MLSCSSCPFLPAVVAAWDGLGHGCASSSVFTTSVSPSLVQWIEKVIGWLSRVFLQDGPSAQSSPEASSTLKRWRCHVQRFFYRIYASMRIEELFSIIRGASPLGWRWVDERSL